MSVSDINSKRKMRDKLDQVLETDSYIVAYQRKDGSIGTLSTCQVRDAGFLLKILEYLYVTTYIGMSATEIED